MKVSNANDEDRDLQDASPQQLVITARRRDATGATAFAELIRRFEKLALALAYSTLGDAALAADVTQDALIRAWQRLEELNEPQRFGAWLGRIVRNLALDARRSQPRGEIRGSIDEFDPPHMCDPSRDAEEQEMSQRIDKALATLDEQTRCAVVLRYYENLSSRQIGEILDISPAAVDMRLSRARNDLKEKLAWADPATNGTH